MSVTARDEQIEQLIDAWSKRCIVELTGPVDEFDNDDAIVYRAAAAAYDHFHHPERHPTAEPTGATDRDQARTRHERMLDMTKPSTSLRWMEHAQAVWHTLTREEASCVYEALRIWLIASGLPDQQRRCGICGRVFATPEALQQHRPDQLEPGQSCPYPDDRGLTIHQHQSDYGPYTVWHQPEGASSDQPS